MNRIVLREYITANGVNPFRSWLTSIRDIQDRGRIRARLDRLLLGNFGDVKFVGGGVYEMRLIFGPGYRVYFGQKTKMFVLLLCGGDKKTQAKDIDKAKKYWADFCRVL